MSRFEHPLHNHWHVVALSAQLGEKPHATTLMDEEIVLWRADGKVVALSDRCTHRGTRLSLGWVENQNLVCPYHGWQFASTGEVVRIPSLPPERPVPAKACAQRYHCVERYGLVFVCLGEPTRPLYEVPEFEDGGFRMHLVGPTPWQTSAARSLENFMDETHLPWVHPDMLGNPDAIPVVETREVEEKPGEFYFECQSEVSDRIDRTKKTMNRLTYHIVLPFTLYHENIYPNGDRVIDLFFTTPVSRTRTVRYMVVARNFALEQPSERLITFTEKIWEQDRPLIESQRPAELPLKWDDEMHLRGPDGPSIVYRRMLAQAGMSQFPVVQALV